MQIDRHNPRNIDEKTSLNSVREVFDRLAESSIKEKIYFYEFSDKLNSSKCKDDSDATTQKCLHLSRQCFIAMLDKEIVKQCKKNGNDLSKDPASLAPFKAALLIIDSYQCNPNTKMIDKMVAEARQAVTQLQGRYKQKFEQECVSRLNKPLEEEYQACREKANASLRALCDAKKVKIVALKAQLKEKEAEFTRLNDSEEEKRIRELTKQVEKKEELLKPLRISKATSQEKAMAATREAKAALPVYVQNQLFDLEMELQRINFENDGLTKRLNGTPSPQLGFLKLQISSEQMKHDRLQREYLNVLGTGLRRATNLITSSSKPPITATITKSPPQQQATVAQVDENEEFNEDSEDDYDSSFHFTYDDSDEINQQASNTSKAAAESESKYAHSLSRSQQSSAAATTVALSTQPVVPAPVLSNQQSAPRAPQDSYNGRAAY